MSILSRQEQADHVVKLLKLLKSNPTPKNVALVHKLAWELPGKLGEENGIIVNFGEYIGTLDDIVNNRYADDGWLAEFKKYLLDDLASYVDKRTLDEFRKSDHLELITGINSLSQQLQK